VVVVTARALELEAAKQREAPDHHDERESDAEYAHDPTERLIGDQAALGRDLLLGASMPAQTGEDGPTVGNVLRSLRAENPSRKQTRA